MTGGPLTGRVAIVTGAARGMGAAHARMLVAEGAAVVLGDVLERPGRALAGELGSRARFQRHDVREPEDWAALIATAEERFGPVSVLINNAGVVELAPLADVSLADWQRVIDINLTGTFLGIQAAAPSMRRAGGGCIVNVSSIAGLTAVSPAWAYTASKWGVRGLTKVAALELAADRIRVNSIHPGFIRTPMTEGAAEEPLTAGIPLGRFGEAEEVARLVRYLVLEATYATGSEFAVDGGVLAGVHALEEPTS